MTLRPSRIIATALVPMLLLLLLMHGPHARVLANPISKPVPALPEFDTFRTGPMPTGMTNAAGSLANTTHSVGRGGPEGECWRAIHVKPLTCKGIRKHCAYYGKGALDYLDIYYCSPAPWRPVLAILLAGWIALLFIWLGVSASDYFSPNISTLVKLLHLPESIAGVTLLAFGNGAPDLFGTYSAVKAGSGALAIGQLIGSASFITAVVVGATTIVVPSYRVNPMTYLRELWFFVASVAAMAVIIVTGRLTRLLALCMVGLYLLYAVTVVITTYYEHQMRDYFFAKAFRDVSEDEEVSDVAIRLQQSPIVPPVLVISEPTDTSSLSQQSSVHRSDALSSMAAPASKADSHEDEQDDEFPEQVFEEFLLYHRRSMLTAVELTDFMAELRAAREEAHRQTLQAHNSMPLLCRQAGYQPVCGDDGSDAGSDGCSSGSEYLEAAVSRSTSHLNHPEFAASTPTPPWSNYTMHQRNKVSPERSPSRDLEMGVGSDTGSARSIRLAKTPLHDITSSAFRSEPNLIKRWIEAQSAQRTHAVVPPTPLVETRPVSMDPPERLVRKDPGLAPNKQINTSEQAVPTQEHEPELAGRQDSGHSEQQCVIPTIWVQPPTPMPPPRRRLHHPLDELSDCPSSPRSTSDHSSRGSSVASYSSSINSPQLSIVPHTLSRPTSGWSSVSTRANKRAWRGRAIALLRCSIPTLRHWRADATVLRKLFIVYSAIPMLLLTLTVPVLNRPPSKPLPKAANQDLISVFQTPTVIDDDEHSPMMEQAIHMNVQRQQQHQPPRLSKRASSPENRLLCQPEASTQVPRRSSLPPDRPMLPQPDESARLLPEHGDPGYGTSQQGEHLELQSRHMSLVTNRSHFVGHSFPTGVSPTQSFSAASGFSFETNLSHGMWLAAVDPQQIMWAKAVMMYVRIIMTAMFLYYMLGRAVPDLLDMVPPTAGYAGVSVFFVLFVYAYSRCVPDSYLIRVLPCFIGFVSGLAWIYIIADEIVAITQTVGLVLDISEEILGLTLVGFGNSVGDLVTNVTLATMGYPTMALAACFGGPMVNILLGVGMAAASAMWNRGPNDGNSVEVQISSKTIMVSTACLLFNALVYVVIVPRQQYHMTRVVGLTAMAVYFVGMAVNVYLEW